MKKMRVYSVVKGILIFYAIFIGSQILFYNIFKFNIAELFNLWNLMIAIFILGLATLFGIITKNDFFKDIKGEIFDENETFNCRNLSLSSPFIILSLLQILISFVSPNIINEENLLGLHFQSDANKMLFSTFILYPFPTHLFIIRSFLKRSVVNERDLIKMKRRDRIRSTDLTELDKKVDLEN